MCNVTLTLEQVHLNRHAHDNIDIKNRLLWGCALLKPGIIKSIDNLETVEKYFNAQNVGLKVGAKIPKWQNAQN